MIKQSPNAIIGKIFKRKGRLPLLVVGEVRTGLYSAKQLHVDSICREFLEKNVTKGELKEGQEIVLRDKRIFEISKVHPDGTFQLVHPEITEHSLDDLEAMAADSYLGYGSMGTNTIGHPNLSRKGSSFAWRKQGVRRVLRK